MWFGYTRNTPVMKPVFCFLLMLLMCQVQGQPTVKVYNRANSGLPSDTVNSIAIQSDGKLFIGTTAGFAVFDGKDWSVFNHSNCPLPNDTILAIYFDRYGRQWYCTNDGILMFNGYEYNHFNLADEGITVKTFCSIALDFSNTLWLGSCETDLVCSFDGTRWTTYNLSSIGLATSRIKQIIIADDNTKWIAANGSGIMQYNGNTWNIWVKATSGMPDNFSSCITIDPEGNKWIATYYKLVKTDPGLTTWTPIHSINDSRAIVLDKKGVLWAGAYGSGLFHYDSQNWRQDTGLPDNHVKCLAIDKEGNKWIGTQKGLVCYHEGATGIEGSDPAGPDISVFPNPASEMLNINCEGGSAFIYSIHGEALRTISLKPGLTEVDIRSLNEGMYLLKVTGQDFAKTLKFFKH